MSTEEDEPIDWGDDDSIREEGYFQGVSSPRALFTMHIEALDELLSRKPEWQTVISIEAEVCVIALMSYFEAFCKDVFAGAVNICPQLLRQYREAGQATLIDAVDLIENSSSTSARVGFLLAERIDFGSAKKVNALYSALLRLSPFSRDEARRYEQLLMDRNLLVHHGGIHTSRYVAQQAQALAVRPHHSVISVTREYFIGAKQFLETIADKLAAGVRDRLMTFCETNNVPVSDIQAEAIWLIAWDYIYTRPKKTTQRNGRRRRTPKRGA